MSNLIIYLFIVFMAITGGFSTLYLVISLPTVIIWKIYRKIKYNEEIM